MSDHGLIARLLRKGKKLGQLARLKTSLKRVHGPAAFDLAADDVVVVTLIKNFSYYMDGYFEHYRNLGARHFVFIDNGSTDDTVERLKSHPDCVVLHSTLPMGIYEGEFRRHAAQTYARNHWVLFADSDEMFDFQGRDILGLSGLAQYMTAHSYTAMMAQMLDLFPRGSIQSYAHTPYETVLADFRYYDLSHIRRYDYTDYDSISFSYYMRTNTPATDQLEFMFGGVRHKVFGELCCLTKHPLVFIDDTVWPCPHPHTAAHVRVADVTGVVKHYKFTNDPFQRDMQTLRDGVLPHGEDKLRLETVRDHPDLSLYSDDAQPYTSAEALYGDGFLVSSPTFTQFVAKRRAQV
ncbi:glycosyltransferase family 2 protein [Oceaniglobus ichthyenteri]|uniref:glycosyltransferase family 2 protein n=1 Tax=Oceaniglobus ichthyenteri TaxID=2136177 RepID=UPI000D3407EC|nr:glycosyltransferase family 2 protein [Oceaniglobus ichthyenteri]